MTVYVQQMDAVQNALAGIVDDVWSDFDREREVDAV